MQPRGSMGSMLPFDATLPGGRPRSAGKGLKWDPTLSFDLASRHVIDFLAFVFDLRQRSS